MIKNSPGGGYFPYFYKGGQLFGMHLGSYGKNEAGVIARMKSEQAFLCAQNRTLTGMWLDLCQTNLTPGVLAELMALLTGIRGRFLKLALVGCSLRDRWKISRLMKQTECLRGLPVRYFSDPEVAKTWLVSEVE